MKKLLLTTILILTCSQAWGATKYIRVDGGTPNGALGTVVCNGNTNAAATALTTPNCAYNHINWVVPSYNENPTFSANPTTWLIAGGDEVIIMPGDYIIGCQNTNSCIDQSRNYTANIGSATYVAGDHRPPSGSSGNPTLITGCSLTGCGTGAKPRFLLVGRLNNVFTMTGKSWVTIQDIEITDQWGADSECTAGFPIKTCGRSAFKANGGWSNLTFEGLDIHGLTRGAFEKWGGGGTSHNVGTWTVSDSRLDGNKLTAIDMDTCLSEACGITGTINFTGVTLRWNGCSEAYPVVWGEDGTNGVVGRLPTASSCRNSNNGGYGDAIGTPSTGGTWTFTDIICSHNTSDCIDLRYLGNNSAYGTVDVIAKRIIGEGNVGAIIKGPMSRVENSVLVGNCSYWGGVNGSVYSNDSGSGMEKCRSAGGQAAQPIAVFYKSQGPTTTNILNNTILTNADTLFDIDGAFTGNACSGRTFNSYNNILIGGYQYAADTVGMYYNASCESMTRNENYNICFKEFKVNGDFACTNTNDQNNVNPLFDGTLQQGNGPEGSTSGFHASEFYVDDLTIQTGSPAKNAADETKTLNETVDRNNYPRGASWDIGGYEYGTTSQSGGAADCSAQTISNCDLDLTSSGASDGTCSSGYTGACSYSCTDGAWTLSSNTCVITPCGNLQIDAGEECDGALLNNGTCASEGYSSCAGLPTCTNCVLTQGTCAAYAIGNSCLDPGEQCEDGNTTNKDGCSQLGETENPLYQYFKADYIETDTPATMDVRTHTVRVDNITHAADSSLKRDFGAGFFGNFVHRFKVQLDSGSDNGAGENGGAMVWCLAGASYGDATEMETADDGICLELQVFSSVARTAWKLIEYE